MAGVSPLPKYKLVFLGDESVGKTSMIYRLMYDIFNPTYEATKEFSILSKTMYLEDRTVRLPIWDTAGQERYRSLIPSYIKDSSVAVIVYDVTNRQSFLNTPKWIEQVRTEQGTDVIIVLVGNKTDLADERQVSVEEGDTRARDFGAMFVDTSAKDGYNIKVVFSWIASNVGQYTQPHNYPPILDCQQRSPQEYQQTPPHQMLPHQPQEQYFQPQQPLLAPHAPQVSSSSKSLEEIVKNLAITQERYQQDILVSLKSIENSMRQLVASVGKLEAKESWFPSQTDEVNLKQNNPQRKKSHEV